MVENRNVKGKRLKENYIKVVASERSGQLKITFPMKLAKQISLGGGDIIKFERYFNDSVIIKRVEEKGK